MKLRNDVSITYWKARKCWLVRWHGKYDPATEKQQRFGKSFKRKKDAEKFAQSLKNDINDGISVELKTINLKNLCNKFIEAKKGNVSPETIDAYEDTIVIQWMIAHAKKSLARILGTFNYTLAGNVTINFDAYRTEGVEELARLEEKIKGDNQPDWFLMFP